MQWQTDHTVLSICHSWWGIAFEAVFLSRYYAHCIKWRTFKHHRETHMSITPKVAFLQIFWPSKTLCGICFWPSAIPTHWPHPYWLSTSCSTQFVLTQWHCRYPDPHGWATNNPVLPRSFFRLDQHLGGFYTTCACREKCPVSPLPKHCSFVYLHIHTSIYDLYMWAYIYIHACLVF